MAESTEDAPGMDGTVIDDVQLQDTVDHLGDTPESVQSQPLHIDLKSSQTPALAIGIPSTSPMIHAGDSKAVHVVEHVEHEPLTVEVSSSPSISDSDGASSGRSKTEVLDQRTAPIEPLETSPSPALEYIDPSPSDFEAINLRVNQQEQLRRCMASGPTSSSDNESSCRRRCNRSRTRCRPTRAGSRDHLAKRDNHNRSRSQKRRTDSVVPRITSSTSRRGSCDSSSSSPAMSNSRRSRRRSKRNVSSRRQLSAENARTDAIEDTVASFLAQTSEKELLALGSAIFDMVTYANKDLTGLDRSADRHVELNKRTTSYASAPTSSSGALLRLPSRETETDLTTHCLDHCSDEHFAIQLMRTELVRLHGRCDAQHADSERLRHRLATEHSINARLDTRLAEADALNHVLTVRSVKAEDEVKSLKLEIDQRDRHLHDTLAKHETIHSNLMTLQECLVALTQTASTERIASITRGKDLCSQHTRSCAREDAEARLIEQLQLENERLYAMLQPAQALRDVDIRSISTDAREQKIDNERFLNERIAQLEESLKIARSAAAAALQHANHNTSTTFDNMLGERERIHPQALRQSVLVLQEQLQDRETRIEQLETTITTTDAKLADVIREKDFELSWLRDLKSLNEHELTDVMNLLSQPQVDLEQLRAAIIRMQTNLRMEEASRSNDQTAGPGQTLAGLTNFASPKVAQLAAVIGNWGRRRRKSETESLPDNVLDSASGLGLSTPAQQTLRGSSSLHGFWTPLGSVTQTTATSEPKVIQLNGVKRLGPDMPTPSRRPSSLLSLRRQSYDQDVTVLNAGGSGAVGILEDS